jgi:hypothetical protein
MPRKPSLDKFHKVLFDNVDELKHLNEKELRQLKRYRSIFTLSMDNPAISDIKLRDFLTKEYGISMVQAYDDIHNMRILLGNMRNAGKEWVRYVVNETLKEAIDQAKKQGAKGLKNVIAAAAALAKYNMLDKHTAEELPWEEIMPVSIEPTSDPTVLNVKPLANKEAEIKKLMEKYGADIEIEDVDYEDIARRKPGSKEDLF